MKRVTSLERKGKDPIYPDKVEMARDVDGVNYKFSFPRAGNPITADDKEVTFVSRVGRNTLKAKFTLREMNYKDQLAL